MQSTIAADNALVPSSSSLAREGNSNAARFDLVSTGPQPVRDGKMRRRPNQDTALEHLIASPAGLRVLRVLSESPGALTPPQIAKEGGVVLMSVHRTLKKLAPLGLVEAVGEGRVRLYRMPQSNAATRSFLQKFFRWVAGEPDALKTTHDIWQGAGASAPQR